MVKCSLGESRRLDRVFSALSDPTRRGIVTRLARGEARVGELAAPFRLSEPAITRHVKVLERAGLLAREIDGRVHRCRLVAQPMEDAVEWIDQQRSFWNRQLDALAAYLSKDAAPPTPRSRRRAGRK
ncbi:MAG: metalloregulator ArsR/SmtB family transcription factor [Candidatus Eremiobacteraeota bacterium]|nr:metalloregulator ArsR/SmtB family transcription factor [Candidatus Eremiobacteraeota bacterium]